MTTHYYPGKKENSPIVYSRRHNYSEQNELELIHYGTNLYTGAWLVDNPNPKSNIGIAISVHTSLGTDVEKCLPNDPGWGCI